jgi:PPIC-type PPIASE domain
MLFMPKSNATSSSRHDNQSETPSRESSRLQTIIQKINPKLPQSLIAGQKPQYAPSDLIGQKSENDEIALNVDLKPLMLPQAQPPVSFESVEYATLTTEFLRGLHIRRKLLPLLRAATIESLLIQHAEDANLAVTGTELQTAADEFRQQIGLSSVKDFQVWLEHERLSLSNFEDALKRDLLLVKLRDYLTKGRIAQFFDANSTRYDRARLRQIVLGNEDFANTIIKKIRKQVSDFSQFAHEYSLDRTSAINGGDLGLVFRYQLPQNVSEAVFSVKPDDVVGPVAISSNFYLFLVESIKPAELDNFTVEDIRQELFNSWLSEQCQNLKIDPHFLKFL